MGKFHLSRRTVLRGAGTIAIALPWLEIMERGRLASAEGQPAKRFVTVYTPGGSVIDDGEGVNRWRPTGSETDFALSPILMPLEIIKHKLLVVDGLNMESADGSIHEAGIIAWLTGNGQDLEGGFSRGPSLDQVIAAKASAQKSKQSLQMAVRWGTGKSHGLLHPINTAHYEDNATFDPIPPRLDPQAIFTSLFGALDPNNPVGAAQLARKKSILDFVDRRYDRLAQRLGASDKAKLDQHLTKLRELEKSLENGAMLSGTCILPEWVETSDYNPTVGLGADDDGAIVDQSTDEAIPKVGKFMMDMMVMALACDMTGVASFQWSDTEAKHTFPWLGLHQHHHFYQHDGGFRPVECEQIVTWYSEQHAYLLLAMDAVDMGGHTLLDESVVFFGSELGDPPTHEMDNMPFLLAGGGGGLRGGRYLRNQDLVDKSHNNLLVAILRLFGDERQTFGNPEFCSEPLPNLT